LQRLSGAGKRVREMALQKIKKMYPDDYIVKTEDFLKKPEGSGIAIFIDSPDRFGQDFLVDYINVNGILVDRKLKKSMEKHKLWGEWYDTDLNSQDGHLFIYGPWVNLKGSQIPARYKF